MRLFAAAVSTAVVLFSPLSAWAKAKAKTPVEIESAKEAAVKGQRAEALTILSSFLKKTTSESQRREAQEALDQVANLFYTDKGQKLFEMSSAMLFNNPAQARSQLREAAMAEPGNLPILLAQIQLELFENKCGDAFKLLEAVPAVYELTPGLNLLRIQGQLCGGDADAAEQILKTSEKILSTEKLAYPYLMAKVHTARLEATKAETWIEKALKEDEAFPEAEYLRWKISQSRETPDKKAADKYLALCKNLNTKARKRYYWEPRACIATAEVEAERAKPAKDDGGDGG